MLEIVLENKGVRAYVLFDSRIVSLKLVLGFRCVSFM